MKTLKDIKKENEIIINYTLTSCYATYQFLHDKDYKLDDIHADLEYTLHRMKQENFTDEDILYNCDMFIPNMEEWEALEEYEEYYSIDLGYIVDGLLISIKEEA